MKKILVTGADGFIGSHLTDALVRDGHDVRAFVCYNSFGSRGWLDHTDEDVKNSLEIFSGDVRDPNGVRTAMKDRDTVFHLAALIAIPYSYHSPDSYIDTNVRGTLNIVQAARDLGVGRVVCTSTSEVYGTARFVPITEDHPLQPQSPYSASKIGADAIALSFYHSFETPVVILRPFNTFGPRQSARAIIPTVIGQIASGQKDLSLGALRPTRDFSYVKDTVRGFIQAALCPNLVGQTVQIGSGHEISIGHLAALIAELMDTKITIHEDPARLRPETSEVERLLADTAKAQRIMEWNPAYAGPQGFRLALQETIAWFRKPDHLKFYKTGEYNL